MLKKKLYISLLLLCGFNLFGQQQTAEQVIETIIERIAAGSEEELEYSELTANLEYYYESPLNLNTASINDLEELVILNDFQIKNLVQYRQSKGSLLTLYELQYIEGFNYTTIKLLLPFVCIQATASEDRWKLTDGIKYGRNEIFFRTTSLVKNPTGYDMVSDSVFDQNPNKYYPGNKHRIYTRYKFNYKNKLLWGITAEKDPGEQFFKGNQQYGFDFYSAHLQIKDLGRVKNIVIGDYQGQFGQGLLMWSYLSNNKSAYTIDVRKRGQGLRKYSSTDENAFLRGLGTTIEFGNFNLSVFGSYKKRDANFQEADTIDNETAFFSSFDNSGIHATPNQIAKKDAITEMLSGANLNMSRHNFSIGLTGIAIKYSSPLQKDSSIQNQFDFQGKENLNIGGDFQLLFKNIHFFGEAGLSKNMGYGVLVGALLELTSQLNGAILYRNYTKDFQSIYGNSFAEGSAIRNEKGFYTGIEILPVKRFKLAAYYDFFTFPWLKQQSSSPTKGNDYLIQLDFVANRKVSMYTRLKQETKQTNLNSEIQKLSSTGEEQKLGFRYHISYIVSDQLQLRNRIELSRYSENSNNEYGYLLFQDIIFNPKQLPFKFSFRYAYFDTDSYNSRIYTYESDVLNAYSVPAIYDKGTRTYFLIKYTATKKIDLWLRYGHTWYANRTSIGSGMNEINGNTKSEIKFQLRWKI